MPLVKIYILKGWSSQKKRELHRVVHSVLVESLQIDNSDFYHRIFEFNKEDFVFPDTKSGRFLIIEIHLFPGRSQERKKKMYATLCNRLEIIGIPRTDIFIQVIEQPLQNWSVHGGISGDEADIQIKE